MKTHFLCIYLALLLPSAARAHYHCNVGSQEQVPGTPLFFVNGDAYIINSGFVLTLNMDAYPGTNSSLATSSSSNYAGYFVTTDNNGITFTAYDSDPSLNVDPICTGAQVCLRFASVLGPPGGSFGVWDVTNFFVGGDYNSEGNDATSLAYSLPAGTTNGTNFIQLSANDGGATDDPYGHIHGRQFSATIPGLYLVTVQAFDNSHNGAGGGPVQRPSDFLPIYFQAGSQMSALVVSNSQVAISFPAQLGTDYYLQANSNLANTNGWQTINGPISGADSFQLFFDTDWNESQRFYRLMLTPTPQ